MATDPLDARPSTLCSTPRPSAAWFLLVLVLTLIAYARSFTASFQFDDYQQILESPAVLHPSWSTFLTWGRTRVIPTATLALNYQIGGESVVGYHVVNLAIHLLTCWVVYVLVLELCRTPRVRDMWFAQQAPTLALATVLLFACHPIQVQAVTYIVQRISSLAACFYFGSVLCYVRARNASNRRGQPLIGYAVAALLAVAAFFSKENTASLPLAILLTDVVFFGRGLGQSLLRVVPFAVLMLVIPLTFRLLSQSPASAAPGQGTWVEQQTNELAHALIRGGDTPEDVSPLDYFYTQCVVIPRYLGLVVLPWGFSIDHDVPLVRSLSASVIAGFTFLVALLSIGVYSARRWPLLGFGILWFFVALSVESSLLPIRDVMNEHRMYLAIPGVALVVACLFARLCLAQPMLARVAATAVVTLLVALTIARNEIWQTQLSLWRDALSKSPNKARVHVNLGTALHLQGDVKQAIQHYCAALKIEPTNRRAESNINIALDQLVEDGEAEMVISATGPDGSMELAPRHPCPPGER